MAKAFNSPREKRKPKLIVRLLVPMMVLMLFQLLLLFAILGFGGEFTYVQQYAYSTLAEKTENRKGFVENEWRMKMPSVQECAVRIGEIIDGLLEERGEDISDIQVDRELNRLIMESSLDEAVGLLRRSMSNDVYLILETGNLYSDEAGSGNAKAALYLRDLDTTTDGGYEDLLMEIGFSSVAQEFGIVLDSGWTLHFESDPDDDTYDFYYKTVRTAWNHSGAGMQELGYWSGFSKLSRSAASSMKYTVPLIAEDGLVYGVLGIGMTENTILSGIPASDFTEETACYVLGRCERSSESELDIVIHSGGSFAQLVGNADTLTVNETLGKDVCDFKLSSGTASAGSVQYINLYSSGSPYYNEQWALISVADRSTVLRPLSSLVQMLILASLISLAVSVAVVIFSCSRVVKPISAAINTMATSEYNQVIRFKPSNIYELDKMTDSITQLQINVQDFSSQVSQMIRIANVGLGTFMYDSTDDSVFVGQNLFKLMTFRNQSNEDVVMSRQSFLDSLENEEHRRAIAEGLQMLMEVTNADYSREYAVSLSDGSTMWMRLTLVHDKNKSIGVMQNITDAMVEKKRVEYERDHDSITGLLNRQAYYKQIEELFAYPEELKIAAFVMIDLDNLKYVNDTYGHDFGDDYIKTAAAALKTLYNHNSVVSRLSGDEFNIFLYGFSSKDEVRRIISETREQLVQSYCLLADGTHFRIRASAGVSWYPDNSTSYEMLMKYADFAMYTVKHSTKGELAEFDETAYEKDSLLITGVEEMNRVIDECSVQYAFHTIISAKTGEVYGYEALMRPQSSIFQSPLELLRTAKTGAKLYEIEKLTWHKALADFKKQIDAGHISKDSHVFINSISNCVMDSADVDVLEELYPDLLPNIVLEVLEGEDLNEEYNRRKQQRMKKWHAQVALDDFGSGYNSEYALITTQPNIIKIDRSIISGCDKDISRRMIIKNLIKLGRSKNITVLAEGVETEDELETVIECGVDLLQGYYINRPVFEPQPVEPELVRKIRKLSKVDEGSAATV